MALVSLAFVGVLLVTFGSGARPRASAPVDVSRAEAAGSTSSNMREPVRARESDARTTADRSIAGLKFSICHTGGGVNCVVDGDTAWIEGEKIRVADIDAPETHPSRCEEEARLGTRATERLAELLNAGALELKTIGRDVDRYGRKLRVITRGGRSLGDQLVSEGLARTWEGRRRPWC